MKVKRQETVERCAVVGVVVVVRVFRDESTGTGITVVYRMMTTGFCVWCLTA